ARQDDCAQRAGVVAESAGDDLHTMRVRSAQKILISSFPDGRDEVFSHTLRDAAADHDALRVEQVHHIGGEDPQVVLSALHHLAHDSVLLLERRVDDAAGHALLVALLHDLGDYALAAGRDGGAHVALHSGAAGERLRAAAAAAGAHGAVNHQDGVADLAGAARASHVELTSDDDPAANPGAHEDPGHFVHAPARAEDVFAHNSHIDVVIHHDRDADQRLELVAERHILPAQIGRLRHNATPVNGPRSADAYGAKV